MAYIILFYKLYVEIRLYVKIRLYLTEFAFSQWSGYTSWCRLHIEKSRHKSTFFFLNAIYLLGSTFFETHEMFGENTNLYVNNRVVSNVNFACNFVSYINIPDYNLFKVTFQGSGHFLQLFIHNIHKKQVKVNSHTCIFTP